MMFMTEGVYTRKVASEVGSAIKYMVEHPEDDRFFELQLVRHTKTGDEDWTEFFRPIDIPEDRVFTFANESELVRCITTSGRRLDIIFGHEAEREVQPALVLLGVES
jgi:hypothetical protein